jgi:hypothetical protein
MRTIAYILLSVVFGLLSANAQKTLTEKSTSSVSISIDGDLTFSDETTYFSTSDSDDTYKIRAKFNEAKTRKIRDYLLEELGAKHMRNSGSKQYWKMEYDGITAYEVKVDDGSLRIFVDKEVASSNLLSKFKTIRKNIKEYTSGQAQEKREEKEAIREEARIKREAEQKIREAERLEREAARLKREAERMTKQTKSK